jgi:hypothetical protein
MLMLIVLQSEAWSNLSSRLGDLGRTAGDGALDLAIAIVVLLVGWGLAALVSRLVRALLRSLRFNTAVERVLGAGTSARHEPAGVAAWAVYWLMLAAVACLALDTLGFDLAASVAERLGDVVPRIVTSAVLFAVGVLLALLFGSITRRFLESADLRAAQPLGQVVTGVLTGFAALLALEQLGFAAQFVMAVGVVAVAAAGLGLALAFGLGCRDLARDFLVEYLRSLDDEGTQRPK